MTFTALCQRIGAEILVAPGPDREVRTVCASDLLSDILASRQEEFAILTGMVSPQVIRTAEVVDAVGIVFVRGKALAPNIVALARARGVPIAVTDHCMFAACALLADLFHEAAAARPEPALHGPTTSRP